MNQPYSLVQTIPPTGDPVSVGDLRADLGLDHGRDDALLSHAIAAATRWVELTSGRQLVQATWRLGLDRWPTNQLGLGRVDLPRPPLVSVSSVQYVDTAGTTQTWAASNYLVDTASEPGRIVPAYGITWPAIRCQPNAILITFVAGYGTVPETFRRAIRLLACHWYENREAVTVGVTSEELQLSVACLIGAESYGNYA